MQDGATPLLYISSYKSDSHHIKDVVRQSRFFFPFFPLSFFPPPASYNARPSNYYATLAKPNAYLMPTYLHTGRRDELESRRLNPIKCLCGWCDESADAVCRAFFKLPGGGAGIVLTLTDCVAWRELRVTLFYHFYNCRYRDFGAYLYLFYTFLLLVLLSGWWLCCFSAGNTAFAVGNSFKPWPAAS